MPLKPESKYEALVLYAVVVKSKKKGTGGIFFALKTNDGRVDHTEWITSTRANKIRETLENCFGIAPEEISDPKKLRRIGDRVRGAVVSITTDEGGQYGVKVKWMNPVGPKAASLEDLVDIASVLGGAEDCATEPGPADWALPPVDF